MFLPSLKFNSPFIKGLLSILLFFSILIGILLVVEFYFRLPSIPLSYTKVQPTSPLKPHPILGYQLNDDGVYECSFYFRDNSPPIHSHATLKDGLRLSPVSEGKRDKFAVFFGDSLTFGEGVNDTETFPYYFGDFAPEYRPYNFGVPGGSVQNMYYRLSTEDLNEIIKETSGIGVYWYFGFHTMRLAGAMPYFNIWVDKTACYEMEAGSLVYKGSFREAHPKRSMLYDLLYMSRTCRYAGLNLPLRPSPKDFDRAAIMLLESAQLFKEQFPESIFIVMFMHYEEYYQPIMEYLRSQGIFVFETTGMLKSKGLPDFLPDGHMRGEHYKHIAEKLAQKVQEFEIIKSAE